MASGRTNMPRAARPHGNDNGHRTSIPRRIGTLLFAWLALSSGTRAQFVELEPNQLKATATPVVCLSPGGSITGTTTGASTLDGPTSADVFLLATCPAPPGIYRNDLTLTTSGAVGHTATILGLPQNGAPSETTSVQLTSSASTPPRFNRWFGSGRGEMIYYRVTGLPTTTEPYVAVYSRTLIQPVNVTPSIRSGLVVITTSNRTLLDTELFLYDASMNLIRWNDDTTFSPTATQSRIDVNLTPGVYYLAVSIFNTAIAAANGAAPPNPPDNDDRSISGNRMDFPDSLVRTSFSAALQDLDFAIIDALGTHDVSAAVWSSYDIYWARITVVESPTACCFSDGGCALIDLATCAGSGGQSQGAGTTCITPGCAPPEACCLSDFSCVFVAPAFCNGTSTGAGSNCTPDLCLPSVACCLSGAACVDLNAPACVALGGAPGSIGSNCSSTVCAPTDPCSGVLAGDANCSGAVNNFDIDFFVLGVLNPPPPDVSAAPAEYLVAGGTQFCWEHRRCWGDVNWDGGFNNFDIDAFVSCILSPPSPGSGCDGLPSACCVSAQCVEIRPAGCALAGGVPFPGAACVNVSCP